MSQQTSSQQSAYPSHYHLHCVVSFSVKALTLVLHTVGYAIQRHSVVTNDQKNTPEEEKCEWQKNSQEEKEAKSVDSPIRINPYWNCASAGIYGSTPQSALDRSKICTLL